MSRKKRLAILAGCMMLCSAGLAAVAGAEEAARDGEVAELEEVTVTAARFKALNPVKFTVITEEDIKTKGAQTAADALKDVTGLYITTNNTKGKATAQFRGSNAENTKIYIDGVPLSPVGDGQVDLSSIPADNIAKIEVIKGAVPAIYGTDAPGGVIYITTKKAPDKAAASLSVTSGSFNDEKYFFSVGGKANKLSYLFSLKDQKTDGYTVHSKESGDYYNGKVSFDLNRKSNLTIFGSYSEQQKQIPNRIDPATGEVILNGGQGGVVSGRNNFWSNSKDWEYDSIENTYAGALYNLKLNNKSDLSLRFYQSEEHSKLKAYGWLNGIYWGWKYQDWDGTVEGWELQNTIRTSRANTVTWGYNLELRSFTEYTDQMNTTTRIPANYDYKGKSFYLQDTTNVSRKLATSIGYRHYEIEDDANIGTIAGSSIASGKDTAGNPVASFNYALSDTANLHGSVGKSFRWPNARERSGPGGIYGAATGFTLDTNGKIVSGNGLGPNGLGYVCDYLLPEEAINRELGVGYQKHGFKFDLTFFDKDITNMIKGQGFGQGHTQYYNIPHVDMQGYELEVNKKIRNGLKAFLNYSYTNAYDPLVGAQVRGIPFRKVSLGLNYVGQDGVNANLAVNYMGSCASAFSNGDGNGSMDNPLHTIVQNIPAYTTVDLKIGKSKDNRDYYVKIVNLFDKKYYQGAYLIAPGRYVEVGTTIKL